MLSVFFPLFFYNKLRSIFCSVGKPSTRKAHDIKIDNMWRWFSSHWSSPLWKKTPSTPDRRRTYGLLITQSPDALPQSYKKFFGAKDTKLGLFDKHPAILLLGSESKNIFLKVSLVLLYNNYSSNEIELNFSW